MAEMNKKDFEAFSHFIKAYKHQWDLNRYFRDQYDEDMSYYLSYRQEERYPLAYNMSFNKLLPRIFTLLSRFMGQLYQAGTGNLVSVRPRKRQDVERAPRVQGLLDYQLESLNDIDMQGGSYLFNHRWMFDALTWGKGICKLYWRKEERIAPRRVQIPVPQFDRQGNITGLEMKDILIEAPQIVYDGPYAENIHPKLFVGHPHFKSIQQMPNVFVVYNRTIDELKKRVEQGIYKRSALKNIGFDTSNVSSAGYGTHDGRDSSEQLAATLNIEDAMIVSKEDLRSDRVTPSIDVIEGYGRYIFPEDESSYTVGSGIKIKGRESDALVHIGNYKTLLSLQKYNYGFKPFFDIGAYLHPELFWDIGIIRLGKDIQESYDTLGNTRFQNAIMLVNQMLKVNQNADIDPRALTWKPFGLIPVDDMNDVQPLLVNDVSQTNIFREQEQFFESALEDMTGMYKYNLGQEPQRQEHVGTIHAIQSFGEARTKLLLMTMDHQGFRPFFKYQMLLNTWHLPSDFEAKINTQQGTNFTPMFPGDIHTDYDFSARYTAMEPALGKQFRATQLIQYAQMWQDSPYLQQQEFMKAILELMDFHDTDKYLKSEQELQREQQRAVQAQLMQASIEDQMDANKQERKLISEVAKNASK